MKKWSKGLMAAGLCVALTVGSSMTVFAQMQGAEAAVRTAAETEETAGPVQAGEEDKAAIAGQEGNAGSSQVRGELKDIEEEKIPLADAVSQGGGFLGALGIGGGAMAVLIFSSLAIVSLKNKRNYPQRKGQNGAE